MLKGLGGMRLPVSRLSKKVDPDPNGNRQQRRVKIVRESTR